MNNKVEIIKLALLGKITENPIKIGEYYVEKQVITRSYIDTCYICEKRKSTLFIWKGTDEYKRDAKFVCLHCLVNGLR
jgi:hypothetical protein